MGWCLRLGAMGFYASSFRKKSKLRMLRTERGFGWALKPVSSSHFDIHRRGNGQFRVVLNHALLRGVSAEMIEWWFLNFMRLKVRLGDVPGYEGQKVPGYWLWHPIDHLSAELSGTLGPGGVARPGCAIHIREAMQYDHYGWKYPVDTKLKVFLCEPRWLGNGQGAVADRPRYDAANSLQGCH